jgi:signal transduction histidine kinase
LLLYCHWKKDKRKSGKTVNYPERKKTLNIMKTFILFILLLLCARPGHTQSAAIDSFTRLINKAQSDTARINLVNKRNVLISRINIDTAITINKKTIEEATAIKYHYGEATARGSLATNYCMKGEFPLAEENLAISMNIFKTLKDSAGLCNTYSGYGMMHGMQSRYDSSIHYMEQAIAIAERNNFRDKLGSFYGNIAIGYQMQSNFLTALSYQQKSLDLAKSKNDISGQAYTSLNMGLTYSDMDDTLRAEQFLLESIKLAKLQNMKNVELYAYSNLASLYSKKKETEKAYQFAMKAAQLGKETGDQGILAASLSKAAESLADMKKLKEAEDMAKQAIIIGDSSGQTYNIYQAYSAMGTIVKQLEKYKDAIPYLEKSIAVLANTDLYNEAVATTYNSLSVCYEKTGNFSKALSFYKTSAEITDSIRNRDNIRKATELSMNYEFDKKQEAQRIEQKNKDAVTRTRQSALIIGLALTLILATAAYKAYRSKQKVNSRLQQQKEEIQTTLTKLENTQAQLIQSEKMASLGELTAGIAHEIQNPLNFVNNFSEVNGELINELKNAVMKGNMDEVSVLANDIESNSEKINHHGKRADAIVKGMLQHSRSSSGAKEPININTLCDEYLRLSYHGMRAKDKSFNATYQTDFDETIEKINIVPQEIGRVVLNLITNAFYAASLPSKGGLSKPHKNKTPTVWVSTKREGTKILITIRDNGPGIPANILDKIFQPFFTTKPTGQGTGLGLSLAYDIIKAHGGEIKANSKEGEGAEFIVQLPAPE